MTKEPTAYPQPHRETGFSGKRNAPGRAWHLHLVSDSTGETVASVARAALAQFNDAEPEEHVWSLVRTKGQLEKVIANIDNNPGVVMFTLVDTEMREMLRQACGKRGLPCIPILGHVIRELSNYLHQEATGHTGAQYELSEDYFARIDAINFALDHDDGQATWELEQADIVIVGVSRTSKSPTCVYLAYRGYKAANVPYVPNIALPENIAKLKQPLVVGLTIAEDRLIDIRTSRLAAMQQDTNTDYVNEEKVHGEIEEAKKFFRQQGWPVIDVTRRSVEETATLMIQYRLRQVEKRRAAAKEQK
jgi:[pyruvate, water dikinase]-phosphate phosphotransferase / [pyruvate, water dikinase] kinase